MPFIPPHPPPDGASKRNLKTFDFTVQQYGTFFSGFPWQVFGCGTYRSYTTIERAKQLLAVHFDRLRRSIRAPIAYLAVPEQRTSGLGHPAIPLHWHFVASVPQQHTTTFLHNARGLWKEHYGNAKVDRYDADRSGAHYLAKSAGGSNFDYVAVNLKRLCYSGPADLFEHFQKDPYVPDHVRHMTSGQTLSLRSHLTGTTTHNQSDNFPMVDLPLIPSPLATGAASVEVCMTGRGLGPV
jgi:hypothetical protein